MLRRLGLVGTGLAVVLGGCDPDVLGFSRPHQGGGPGQESDKGRLARSSGGEGRGGSSSPAGAGPTTLKPWVPGSTLEDPAHCEDGLDCGGSGDGSSRGGREGDGDTGALGGTGPGGDLGVPSGAGPDGGTGGGPTGGHGGVGASATLPSTSDSAWQVHEEGFVTSCRWFGYAWTAAGTEEDTISPASFDRWPEGEPLCVRGQVAPHPEYLGWAALGVNLGQAGADEENVAIEPTGEALRISVSNASQARLRVQIQGADGPTDAEDRWCASLSDGQSEIPWSSFNTACWDDSGDFYQGQPINTVLVLVPGDNVDAIPYSFCLDGFAPEPGCGTGGGGGGGGGAGGGAGAGGTPAAGGFTHDVSGPPGTEQWSVHDRGFVTACDWSGYAWTAADYKTTLYPADYDSVAADDLICAKGVVGAQDDYSGFAIVGLNLNQEQDEDTTGTVMATGEGLQVSVTNYSEASLRVQIQGPDGSVDEEHRWCAELPSRTGGLIPWSDFNTYCWDYSGDFYTGEPLSSALIIVPGSGFEDIEYDFCIDGIFPAPDCGREGSGGSTGSAGSGAAGSGGSGTAGLGGASNPGTGGAPGSGPWTVHDHGYVTGCGWSGHAWTSATPEEASENGNESTISPASFYDLVAGESLCASGHVGAQSDYSGAALLGVNLAQAEGQEVNGTVEPAGDGLVVSISSHLESTPLRIQLSGPEGATNEEQRWCAEVSRETDFIPWGEFNTACWDDSGTFYDGQALSQVMVMVPGSNTRDVSYDFCVDSIYPNVSCD